MEGLHFLRSNKLFCPPPPILPFFLPLLFTLLLVFDVERALTALKFPIETDQISRPPPVIDWNVKIWEEVHRSQFIYLSICFIFFYWIWVFFLPQIKKNHYFSLPLYLFLSFSLSISLSLSLLHTHTHTFFLQGCLSLLVRVPANDPRAKSSLHVINILLIYFTGGKEMKKDEELGKSIRYKQFQNTQASAHTHPHSYTHIPTHITHHTHICVYLCVCVCVYECVYVCVCLCFYVCFSVCLYVGMYMYMSVYVWKPVYVFLCLCFCLYLYQCVCVFLCVCVCVCFCLSLCVLVCMCMCLCKYVCACAFVCFSVSVYVCVWYGLVRYKVYGRKEIYSVNWVQMQAEAVCNLLSANAPVKGMNSHHS